ncbi:hypothetical protein ACO0RG_003931 [Hanseniaspora osmophila]
MMTSVQNQMMQSMNNTTSMASNVTLENNYLNRNIAPNNRKGPYDPRTRVYRHTNTPERLTRGIAVTRTPSSWTLQTIESLFAGSGDIVKLDESRDPRTNKLLKYTVVYKNHAECSRAMMLISQITPPLPCAYEMAMVTDNKYPRHPKSLKLTRTHFPRENGQFILPQEMLQAVPLQDFSSIGGINGNNNSGSSISKSGAFSSTSDHAPSVGSLPAQLVPPAVITLPDVLTKASTLLPPYKPDNFAIHAQGTEKRIDETMAKVPAPQLIEIVANLKNLAQSQQGININLQQQLEQFLSGNDDVCKAISQLLYEYDLLDVKYIDTLIQEALEASAMQKTQQQQQQQQQQSKMQYSPQQQMGSGQMPVVLQPGPPAQVVPVALSHKDRLNLKRPAIDQKLSHMNDQEASVIRQILEIAPEQIVGLPQEQKQMIENIHKEYMYND